jgi:hypothetical protein
MRTLRRIVLLLATGCSLLSFADEKINRPALPRSNSVLSQGADGTFQFHILPSRETPRQFSLSVGTQFRRDMVTGGVDCYYIDSHKRRRLDNTDETVPAGETTCPKAPCERTMCLGFTTTP